MAYNYEQINFPSLPQEHIPPVDRVVVDPTLKKYGAAADAYVTGNLLKTKLDGEAITESDSLMIVDGKVQLDGFPWAAEKSVPHKEDNRLNWYTFSTISYTGKFSDLTDAPTKLSQFENDVPFATSQELNAVNNDLSATKATLNIVKQDTYDHIGNEVKHITAEERALWNDAAQQVDNINARVTDLDIQVQALDTKVDGAVQEVRLMKASVDAHNADISNIKTRLNAVETTIVSFDNRISAVEGIIPTLTPLEPRVAALETNQSQMAAAIASLNLTTATISNNIDILFRGHGEQQIHLTTIDAAISGLNNVIGQHAAAISEIASDLEEETRQRQLVDGQLADRITAEITAEKTERTIVDGQLADRITSEVAILNNSIAQEAAARQAKDLELDTKITNEGNTRAIIDGQLSDRITAEVADRQSADAALQAEIAKKVTASTIGANGTALIFNESDGGGAKFVTNGGLESFIGVNDGGDSNGIMAQIYADKFVDNKWQGAKLDIYNDGIYYTVGSDSAADRKNADNLLVVKKDIKDLGKALKYIGMTELGAGETPETAADRYCRVDLKITPQPGYVVIVKGTDGVSIELIYDSNNEWQRFGDEGAYVSKAQLDAEVEARKAADALLQTNIDNEVSRAKAQEDLKVTKSMTGANGIAEIFNENDGGGAKFTNNDGTRSYVGVNDGGLNGIDAQIYAVNGSDNNGAKLDISTSGIYYTLGNKSSSERMVAENLLAVKKDVNDEAQVRQTADSALQTNIDAEATARQTADTTLQTNIDNEAATRLSGDQTLTGLISTEETRAKAAESTKVTGSIIGDKGTALIFNEKDGGGAKFETTNGFASFAGVNEDADNGIGAQLYDINVAENSGSKLDVTKNGIYYTKGDASKAPAATRDVEANELATKGELPTCPETADGEYVYTCVISSGVKTYKWVKREVVTADDFIKMLRDYNFVVED